MRHGADRQALRSRMGRDSARYHGRCQRPRRRLPDRRLPRDRARRRTDEGRLARLDLWRQSLGDGGRQRGARRTARRRFPAQSRRRRPDTLVAAPSHCREIPQRLRRAPWRRAAARPALRPSHWRRHRPAAGAGVAYAERRRKCDPGAAAPHHRRAAYRRGGRDHRPGGTELCDMSRPTTQALRPVSTARPLSLPRHFLDLDRIETPELRHILDMSAAFKKGGRGGARPLSGKTLAMIFEKPSTRTRVSFEVAMRQLGGDTIYLNTADSQLGRGETVADTARVLSRYVDAIMIRTNQPRKLDDLARHATVPVINGLTDTSHPCQVMADVMTLQEKKGSIAGKIVAWSGDGSNVAASWVHAAVRFGFTLRLACPEELRPPQRLFDWVQREGGRVQLTTEPLEAVSGADCVVADTWISMGVEASVNRHNMLAPYRVDERLMAHAKPDAIFMHSLPVKRGEEVTAGVIDGPQSVVWDEAENRLHAQKGILAWCLG